MHSNKQKNENTSNTVKDNNKNTNKVNTKKTYSKIKLILLFQAVIKDKEIKSEVSKRNVREIPSNPKPIVEKNVLFDPKKNNETN